MKTERSCGSCTACCKTHVVPSIEKEAYVWCKHCKIGTGCAIYDSRPSECVDFTCMWLIGKGTDEDRPDKSKCVVGIDFIPHLGDTLSILELQPGAHEKAPFAREWLRRAMGRGMPIFIESELGRAHLLIPNKFVLKPRARSILIEGDVAVHRYHIIA